MEQNWTEIKKLAEEHTFENLHKGMNCAEAVYSALISSGALEQPPETVAYATGFGGGGGGTGLTCGALSAAILANNMVHGRKNPSSSKSPTELKEKFYQRYNNIVSDFVKVSGSGLCREIVNQFEDGYGDKATRPNCIRICCEAAKIAAEYLEMDADEAMDLEYDPSVVGIKNWM